MKSAQWILVGAVVAAAVVGWMANEWTGGSGRAPTNVSETAEAGGPCTGGAMPLFWKAPMDPSYVRDAPGKSPMGMDLVPVCPDEATGGATGSVRIDPGLVQSMGVRTTRVQRRDLSRAIRATGRVAFDERRVAHVHTKVQGWVESLHVDYEGQMVERGQPLLELYSPELVATQEELLVAARYRDETSASPFEDVRDSGTKLLDATRRRLELWDIADRDIDRLLTTGDIRKNLTLYSPARGVVTHQMVREGMEVGPNQNLYTIADLSRVWVYADIYEYELPWVASGQSALVELSYLQGRQIEGEVTYVYPFLDPKTRTARVRIEIGNPEALLKPNMFANVRIETQTRSGILVVPDEAVLRSGQRSLVIVALGGGHFAPREVTLGLDSGDGWLEVREGLSESEEIVTSGQFLIDSESRLREAFQKRLGPTAPDATGSSMHERQGVRDPRGRDESGAPDHAGPFEPAATDHGDHAMPGGVQPANHGDHAMPDAPAASDHGGHVALAPEG
jgi:Cu(I)/Ag(I) efflux system membrane fusion protein/cobalt-zinc-cadmium efflux system membrane fusion protein